MVSIDGFYKIIFCPISLFSPSSSNPTSYFGSRIDMVSSSSLLFN